MTIPTSPQERIGHAKQLRDEARRLRDFRTLADHIVREYRLNVVDRRELATALTRDNREWDR